MKFKKLYSVLHFKKSTVDKKNFTLEGVFSTEDEDRHGDVVKQEWDLSHYKANPVILNSHNYGDILDVIGKATSIKVVDGKLQGQIKFAVNENPKAKVAFDLYEGGFLNAFSVGFIPKTFSDKGEILSSELMEISAVAVPANAMALAKSAGIDVSPLFYNDDMKEKNVDDISIEKKSTEKKKENRHTKVTPKKKKVTKKQKEATTIKSIINDIQELGELNNKVETRSVKGDRAKHFNRVANKAIRSLIKLRK